MPKRSCPAFVRIHVRHRGSSRRSSSSSGDRGPRMRSRIAPAVRRIASKAGDTSQASAAIARNESWQPTSKRYDRVDGQRPQRGEGQDVRRPRHPPGERGQAEGHGHDGRAHDRRRRADQHGIRRLSPGRRPGMRGDGDAQRRAAIKSAAASICICNPEIASRCVVPVRAKASLTSGSTPSRRPSRSAAASGSTLGSMPPDQPFAGPGAEPSRSLAERGARPPRDRDAARPDRPRSAAGRSPVRGGTGDSRTRPG